MIKTLAVTIILFSLFVTVPPVDATCTTTKFGNQSFTNCADGVSGFGVTLGGNTFYQFSDGSTGFTSSFGNTSFSSSNQSNLRGTNQAIAKDTEVSQWNNGLFGVHRRNGNVRVDSYSDGTFCTTAPVGTTSFTTCSGNSKDAQKRSSIIGIIGKRSSPTDLYLPGD